MTISSLTNITVTGSDLKIIRPDLDRYLNDDNNYIEIISFQKDKLQQLILEKEHNLNPNLSNDDLNDLIDTIKDTTEGHLKQKITYYTISTIIKSGSINSTQISQLASYYKNTGDTIPLRYKIGTAQTNEFLTDPAPSFER